MKIDSEVAQLIEEEIANYSNIRELADAPEWSKEYAVRLNALPVIFDMSGIFTDNEKAANDLMRKQPGVVLTLKPLKVRPYTVENTLDNQAHVKWLKGWRKITTSVSQHFFWPGNDATCSKALSNKTVSFFIVNHCCDNSEHEYVVCVLGIPSVNTRLYNTPVH